MSLAALGAVLVVFANAVHCSCVIERTPDWARMAAQFNPMEAATSTIFSKVNSFDAKVLEDIVDNHF